MNNFYIYMVERPNGRPVATFAARKAEAQRMSAD